MSIRVFLQNKLSDMAEITSLSQLDPNGYYTYQDYLTWKFEDRVELFKGWLAKMSPAPNRKHQAISSALHGLIWSHLRHKSCHVFSAPFDVRLPVSKNEEISDTVVQPDIVVICDDKKLDEQGCIGAPDLVIEILSPGNSDREMKQKFDLYEASSVQEYWIIDPDRMDVIVYTLDQNQVYIGSRPYLVGDILGSNCIDGLEIELEEIFK